MPTQSLTETKNFIVHLLAEADGGVFTNHDIAEIVDLSLVKVNRALNAARQEKNPFIEVVTEGDIQGYRFIGNKAMLPPVGGSDIVVNSEVSEAEPSGQKDEESSDISGIISGLASMFGKKKMVTESQAMEALGVSQKDLARAAEKLESLGGVVVKEMDDFPEMVIRKTDKVEDFINYQESYPETPKEQASSNQESPSDTEDKRRLDFSVSEDEITKRPEPNSRKKAGPEATPIIDESILKKVGEVGAMSLSGIGRALAGPLDDGRKIGKPRIMKRVLDLVESGQLEKFYVNDMERYRIPGTTAEKPIRSTRKGAREGKEVGKTKSVKSSPKSVSQKSNESDLKSDDQPGSERNIDQAINELVSAANSEGGASKEIVSSCVSDIMSHVKYLQRTIDGYRDIHEKIIDQLKSV